MDEKLFKELKESLKEAVVIAKGEKEAARRTVWGVDKKGKPVMLRRETAQTPDVKIIREKLDLSQSEFANLIKVSVRTLQNWEQGSRHPTGPAEVLLELVSKSPEIVLETLHYK
jgi:putative transcriptional regulator